jgi:hypothetical protein
VRILTEPDSSLCEQYAALMSTEGFEQRFRGRRGAATRRHRLFRSISAWRTSARGDCTRARRLLEELSFAAADRAGQAVTIDSATWTSISATWRATKTSRATSCDATRERASPHEIRLRRLVAPPRAHLRGRRDLLAAGRSTCACTRLRPRCADTVPVRRCCRSARSTSASRDRAVGQYAITHRLRRRPRHRPVLLGLPLRARANEPRAGSAISTAGGRGTSAPDATTS